MRKKREKWTDVFPNEGLGSDEGLASFLSERVVVVEVTFGDLLDPARAKTTSSVPSLKTRTAHRDVQMPPLTQPLLLAQQIGPPLLPALLPLARRFFDPESAGEKGSGFGLLVFLELAIFAFLRGEVVGGGI
jgi:hypothetical protein